jgi:uncharacterized protein (DUF433 family)
MGIIAIEHIEKTPGICGGAARIAGRHIRVSEIVLWKSQHGVSPEEIATRLDLTPGQVYAALSYYHDHREEIEQEMAQESELVREVQAMQAGTAGDG